MKGNGGSISYLTEIKDRIFLIYQMEKCLLPQLGHYFFHEEYLSVAGGVNRFLESGSSSCEVEGTKQLKLETSEVKTPLA